MNKKSKWYDVTTSIHVNGEWQKQRDQLCEADLMLSLPPVIEIMLCDSGFQNLTWSSNDSTLEIIFIDERDCPEDCHGSKRLLDTLVNNFIREKFMDC